jgi:uncharacterized protein
MDVLGRVFERSELDDLLKSPKAELVAITGRRRVGKTFLIRNHYQKHIVFEFTGIYLGDLDEHMDRFSKAIGKYFFNGTPSALPKNWYEAFDQLEKAILGITKKNKKVIFFDELPWMGGSHAKFKKAFSTFWNSFASTRSDIIVVITGSSTSWMHNEIFKDKGGLYQRITKRIFLEPFTLRETELFIKNRKLLLNRQSILELHLIFGGIPFYLDLLKPGESVTQAVDRLFFRSNAELKSEFKELFMTLFNDSKVYHDTVSLLANHIEGITRNDLLTKLKLPSGGTFSYVLDDLEQCGFITSLVPVGNKNKDKKFKLTDAYTLFYLRFVKNNTGNAKWEKLSKTQSWISWSGVAFENVCRLHIQQIKAALQIAGIHSVYGAWFQKGNDVMHGAQIDLLIDRDDKVINICEIKYYNNKVTITKEMAQNIRGKMASFEYFTKTRKSLFPILIAPYGIHPNIHSNGLIQNVIEMDDMF